MGSLRHGLRRVANRFCALSGSASHAYTPRHATEPRVGRIGAQSVAPPPSATAPTYVPSPGSHCLDMNPAAATLPWCPPPAWVGNHDNTRSTTVVLGRRERTDRSLPSSCPRRENLKKCLGQPCTAAPASGNQVRTCCQGTIDSLQTQRKKMEKSPLLG